MTKLKNKIKEAVSSVLPITCIVFLLSITITPMPVGTMLLFACGAVMLIIGMGLFSLGADMSMMLMGEGIAQHVKKKMSYGMHHLCHRLYHNDCRA